MLVSNRPTLTARLAEWVGGLKWDMLPPAVIEQARRCLLDGLGCGIAGSITTEGSRIIAAVQDFDTHGACGFWGVSARGSAPSAALVNATAMHALEFDDVAYTMGHPGAPVIPVAVALGEWLRVASGRQILLAIVAGYEVGSRIGAALDFAAHSERGWHATSTCGGFAAAAAAGVLLELSTRQLVSALGLAGSTAGGVHAYKADGTMSKRFQAGHAAHDGLVAALLARREFTGPAQILEADWGGLLGMMSHRADPSRVVHDLGSEFAILRTEFKVFPSCGSAHAATEAALVLRTAECIEPEQVAAILVRANAMSARFCGTTAGRSVLAAQMSIPFAVAAALTYGQISLSEYSDRALQDPRLWKMERLVRVEIDPTLPSDREPSVVEIQLKDGRRVSQAVDTVRGSLRRPLSGEDLSRKFHELASLALPRDQVKEIETVVMGDAFLEDPRPLWKVIQPQGSPRKGGGGDG